MGWGSAENPKSGEVQQCFHNSNRSLGSNIGPVSLPGTCDHRALGYKEPKRTS